MKFRGIPLVTKAMSRENTPFPILPDAEPVSFKQFSSTHSQHLPEFLVSNGVTKTERPPRPAMRREETQDAGTLRAQLLETGQHLQQQGRFADAAEMYGRVVAANPNDAQACHLLGVVALNGACLTNAIHLLEKAARLAPRNAEIQLHLGAAFERCGDRRAALLSYEHALRIDPTQTAAWVALAGILWEAGEVTPSLDCLSQALKLDNQHIPARLLLANALNSLGDRDEAIAHYRFILKRAPRHLIASVNLAALLRQQGQANEALGLLEATETEHPDELSLQYNLANTLVDCGRFAEARERYEAILPRHPQPAKVFYNLSTIVRFKEEDRSQLRLWEQTARSVQTTGDDAVFLHFALGKAHDDLADYELAFAEYEKGNQLVTTGFDPATHNEAVETIIRQWAQPFAAPRTQQSNGARPIFIVGMPRSGTTLIEQSLLRQFGIRSLGECELLGQFASQANQKLTKTGSANVSRQRSELAENIAEQFPVAAGTTPGKPFLDKMPTNFFHLGWIAHAFPHARIIHCRRDPRDVCLSCYFQHFTQRLPFAYDIDHLIAFYQQFERLMAHWNSVLPTPILEVSYDEFVLRTDDVIERITAHCDLQRETPAADEADTRSIQTASHWQARQPIYTRSLGRWRHYRAHIQPLIDAFGDAE